MSVPQTKAELLAEIDKTFNKLIGYLDIIPPALAADKSMAGHAKDTMMSVGDLVSYLPGGNTLVVKWITQDECGHMPVVLENAAGQRGGSSPRSGEIAPYTAMGNAVFYGSP